MSTPESAPPFRPVLRQRWSELLFLHWKMESALVARRLPEGLEPDCFDEAAWVAIVPFYMSGIRVPPLPPVPGLRAFPELNLRTYVRHRASGRSGVWFFSLEADHRLAVAVARTIFKLPYRHTGLAVQKTADGWVDYRATARGDQPTAHRELRFRYRADAAQGRPAERGSLDAFLCERYRFLSHAGGGRFLEGRVHHQPYRLCPAEVAEMDAGLFAWNGFEVPTAEPDHVIAAMPVDIAAGAPRRVR
ncbi:MAG: YqjF family protein [Opitutales bacterium]